MTKAEDRRSGRDRDWTDAESEGLPQLETPPPGITADNAVEGTPLPNDHPLGADERGTTALGRSGSGPPWRSRDRPCEPPPLSPGGQAARDPGPPPGFSDRLR